MNKEKSIIIVLCIIIVILIVCVAMFTLPMFKEESKLAIADKTINESGKLVVVLTDAHGIGLPNATINIKLTDQDGITIDEDVTTNDKGKAKLNVEEKGKYSVECTFKGEGKYAASSLSDNIKVKKPTTEIVKEEQTATNSVTPDRVNIELPEFDTKYSKTVGEYKVEAEKWQGESVGGFGVWLYKNGQLVDQDSYLSRAYFYMDGEWKWSDWGNGEDGGTYHKYPVSNDVQIQEIEVKF